MKLDPAPFRRQGPRAVRRGRHFGSDLACLGECDPPSRRSPRRWSEARPHAKVAAPEGGGRSSLPTPRDCRSRRSPPACRRSPQPVLRHPLLQPAALHAAGRADPTAATDAALLDGLEAWLTTAPGQGSCVPRTRPTSSPTASACSRSSPCCTTPPASGWPSTRWTLTGPRIGRPKSATFRTAGRGRPGHPGARSAPCRRPARTTPGQAHFRTRVAAGADRPGRSGRRPRRHLPQAGREDPGAGPAPAGLPRERRRVLPRLSRSSRRPGGEVRQLAAHPHPQAQFLWSIFRDVFHYCAVHLGDIADNAATSIFAMRWGFGWAQGAVRDPGRLRAGGHRRMIAATTSRMAMSHVRRCRPGGVRARRRACAGRLVARPRTACRAPRRRCIQRQLYPKRVLGEAPDDRGETLFENAGVRLWRAPTRMPHRHRPIKSKMHAVGEGWSWMASSGDGARAETELDGW